MPTLKDAVRQHTDPALDLLRRLVRQPSVAATGEGLAECAALVREIFARAGATVQLHRNDGAAPVVIAEFPGASDRTLLFYNHYDVQPPDPLDEWTSPPFEPALRDGRLFGRGVADNKGDLTTRLAAVQALRDVHGSLPCWVKFFVEGEEEVGSVHFGPYVHAHREALRADACIWEFGQRDLKERLEITLGIKGMSGIFTRRSARSSKVRAHGWPGRWRPSKIREPAACSSRSKRPARCHSMKKS